jgi:RNA ligase (TIGR02306 family)
MKITYQRDIEHCEPSQYIKRVTIESVKPAKNSDRLDTIKFKEIGWNAISERGLRKPSDIVMFIPPESVLPFELSEKLNITKHLSKGRVRVVKLRGNRSEGLIVEPEIVAPYIPYILKWEDPPTVRMCGEMLSSSEVSPYFDKFYRMPRLLDEPDIFEKGEEIYYSEKIHGTNFRFGYFKHPHKNEYQLYVGSHNIVQKECNSIYWEVAKKLTDHYSKTEMKPYNLLFFGEIFGPGVQSGYTYDRKKLDVVIFAIMKNGIYLPITEVESLCERFSFPVVKFHRKRYEGLEDVRKLADLPSEYTDKHNREGVVLVSANKPDKMAKIIGFKYQTEKKKKTERH